MRDFEVTIRAVSGEFVTGAVQGAGGILREQVKHPLRRRVEALIERATNGDPLSVYEPKPGHILMFAGYCAAHDGERRIVDLRGAEIV
jgi:hypothetical protein